MSIFASKELSDAIGEASKGLGRRHPAEVTSDRLGDAARRYGFTSEELDMIGQIRHRLDRIASGLEES